MPLAEFAAANPERFRVVVHATSLGRGARVLEVKPTPCRSIRLSWRRTRWWSTWSTRSGRPRCSQAVRATGRTAVDGREVLLSQALEQFRMMTGRELPAELAHRALGIAPPAPRRGDRLDRRRAMRISAALPHGVSALFADSARSRRALETSLVARLEAAGFDEVMLPIVDYLEPYEPLLTPASRRELYQFVDRDGELLALRADFTPMLARLVAPRIGSLELPFAAFYRGDVVRFQEERPGRLRELYQLGAELLGVPGAEGEERMLRLFLELLERAANGAGGHGGGPDAGRGSSPDPGRGVDVVLGVAGALDGLLDRLLGGAADGEPARESIARRELTAALARRDRDAIRRLAGREGSAPLLAVAEEGVPEDLDLLGDAAPRVADLLALRERLAAEADGVRLAVDLAEFAGQVGGAVAAVPAGPGGGGRGLGPLLLRRHGVPRLPGGRRPADRRRRPLRPPVPGARSRGAGGRFLPRPRPPEPGVASGFEPGSAWGADGRRRGGGEMTGSIRRPIRLALGKGRNLAVALDGFRRAGLELSELDGPRRRLILPAPEDGLEVLLLKDADVPLYVTYGTADLGVVGSDLLSEADGDLLVPARFRAGRSRMSLIGREGALPRPGSQVRLATKYPRTARRIVAPRPWGAEILELSGSVELAPLLDLAELALDIVQTGRTLLRERPRRARSGGGGGALPGGQPGVVPAPPAMDQRPGAAPGRDGGGGMRGPLRVVQAASRPGRKALRRLVGRSDTVLDERTVARAGKLVERVRRRGDRALLAAVRSLDGLAARSVAELSLDTWQDGGQGGRAADERALPPGFAEALEESIEAVERFHRPQVHAGYRQEADGVILEERRTPLGRVGIYVPGGRASYPSTVVMTAVPARLAGVREIVVATPPAASPRRHAGGGGAPPYVPPPGDRRGLGHGRRPRGGGPGLRHRDASAGWTRSSAPATPGSPRPRAWSRARWRSTASPARPRW